MGYAAKVYHYDTNKYLNMFGSWRKVDTYGEIIGKCEAPPEMSYSIVAHVDAETPEEAYHLTNSITGYWGENEKVDEVGKKKKRSTTVGDIVKIGDKKYICASVGWEEI